jgi:hypothetical protein
VLSGLLLIMILIWTNILGYLWLPPASDWTKAQIYTLSTKSQNILKGLEKPLKVYVFVDSRDTQDYIDMMTLLDNATTISNKVEVEPVVVTRQPARASELMTKYSLVDAQGMLVVYGTGTDEEYQFIRMSDIVEQPMMMMGRRGGGERVFKGEDALMTAINYLEEGKKKSIIYFTQGHGELDVTGSSEETRPDRKAQRLAESLQKANYEVKGLRLGGIGKEKPDRLREAVGKEVPEDAAVVVVAGPQTAFAANEIEALRQFMNPKEASKKKGKLIILLDVVVGPNERMVQTGLEPLLKEFGVEAAPERILQPNVKNPDVVTIRINPRLPESNPLATALKGFAVPMFDVRPVRPLTDARPGAYQAEILAVAYSPAGLWPETNLSDPVRLVAKYEREEFRSVQEKATNTLPVGLLVSESSLPSGPPGAMGQQDQKPRMVVFGDAGFASDQPLPGVQPGRGTAQVDFLYYSLFASSLAWLRERPAAIGIEPKKRDEYKMNEDTDTGRLLWLPAGLMFVTVLGLGVGMWVVRRK